MCLGISAVYLEFTAMYFGIIPLPLTNYSDIFFSKFSVVKKEVLIA
jgi:hypothetical protein